MISDLGIQINHPSASITMFDGDTCVSIDRPAVRELLARV